MPFAMFSWEQIFHKFVKSLPEKTSTETMKADINLSLFQISIILSNVQSFRDVCIFTKCPKINKFTRIFPSLQQISTEQNLGEE